MRKSFLIILDANLNACYLQNYRTVFLPLVSFHLEPQNQEIDLFSLQFISIELIAMRWALRLGCCKVRGYTVHSICRVLGGNHGSSVWTPTHAPVTLMQSEAIAQWKPSICTSNSFLPWRELEGGQGVKNLHRVASKMQASYNQLQNCWAISNQEQLFLFKIAAANKSVRFLEGTWDIWI